MNEADVLTRLETSISPGEITSHSEVRKLMYSTTEACLEVNERSKRIIVSKK